MKFNRNNHYFRWGITAFLVIAASIIFYNFVFHSQNITTGIRTIIHILMPVVFGLATAYLLTPILNFVEEKVLFPLCKICKIKEFKKRNSIVRGLGILVTAFLFMALIYILIAMMVSQIVPSVENIVLNFDSYTTNFIAWLNKMLDDNPELGEYVVQTVDKYSGELDNWLSGLLSNTAVLIKTVSISVINVLGVLWDFIIGFVISIYVLASKEKFAGQGKKLLYAIFEQDTANTLVRNLRFTHQTFIGFLGGKIIDSIIIGILCFIGTSLMQMPYAALVSVVIGVTNIIPFFGPFLGAIPSSILIFIVDPQHPLNFVYFLLFILALQQFDGNVLGPKILGSSTGLTGFWVIFAITLFGGLFGVVGMIVGVPIFAVIYAAAKAVIDTMLLKKNLPVESKTYVDLDYVDAEGLHKQPVSSTSSRSKAKEKHTWTFTNKKGWLFSSEEGNGGHLSIRNLTRKKTEVVSEPAEVVSDGANFQEETSGKPVSSKTKTDA